MILYSKNPKDSILFNRCISGIKPGVLFQEKSIRQFKNAFLNSKNDLLISKGLSRLGNYYNAVGNYSAALSYGHDLEKHLIKMKDSVSLALVYNLIGNTYMGLNEFDKMAENYQKCYEIAKKINDDKTMAYGSAGLASYYKNKKDYKKALLWNLKALKSFDRLEANFTKLLVRLNIAEIYFSTNRLKEAKEYIDQAEKLLPVADLNYCNIMFYSHKSIVNKIEKKYDEAIFNNKQAIKYALIDKATHNISELYHEQAEIYEKAGKYKEALFAQREFHKYNDSIFNQENNKQILDIEERYKSEKKDAEIKLLQKSNELTNSELKRKSNLIWTFGISGVLVVTALVLLWISVRRKNKNNQLLELKNKVIEEKQNEILSSINYARRIQFTLLASDFLLENNLKGHFVIFKPKDIVSGDFYWAIKTQTHFFLAVCDCTGHGVPGAFMSLLNINFLKEAITEKNLIAPGEIFDFVRQRLIENLNEDGYNDGMDGVLIVQNIQTNEIQYAGANRAPLLICDGQICDLSYDKMPIGKGIKTDSFNSHLLDYKQGDLLYLFTDGYSDQFGGETGKKFKLKNLKLLLQKNSSKDLSSQGASIEEEFNFWKRDLEQLDDVCVFGIQL